MNITAKITGIEYKLKCTSILKIFNFLDLDINNLPSSCVVKYKEFIFGLSKWVSPKRTRSYPYERVYNTLESAKRMTVIPIIKDEGAKGDRDFIQWDTISLMSLLDIFVIFAYYSKAEKHPTRRNKITNQQFDNELVKNKIRKIKNYHSSALHWNLKEIKTSFPNLIQKIQDSYVQIGEQLGVIFHHEQGIKKFARQFNRGVRSFMETSRQKSQEAQNREFQTIQPKEYLSSLTKAKITIENYLGGKYYLTVDEIKIEDNKIFLIEAKHSKTSLLPSIGDIKDGLFKMIIYTNLKECFSNGKEYQIFPILKLSSSKLANEITQASDFLRSNQATKQKKKIVKQLLTEAQENNFSVIIEKVDD